MKKVYIACPISKGNVKENIEKANKAFWELTNLRYSCFNPIWSMFAGNVNIGIDEAGNEYIFSIAEKLPNNSNGLTWLSLDMEWVLSSDAILRLAGESVGADLEVRVAQAANIPVFYLINQLDEYFRNQL